MKRIFILFFILSALALSVTAKTLEATLRNPGDFWNLVHSLSVSERMAIDRIVLRGAMGTTDCLALRSLLGYDHTQARTRYRAKFVDLSGVVFEHTFPRPYEYYIHYLHPRTVEGAQKLPDFLFRNCTLEQVVLPRSIEAIGDGAFEYSDLKEVVIPSNVKRIGNYAFHCCRQLASVTIEGELESVGYLVFSESELLKRLVFNRISMMTKGNYAFIYNCLALEEVIFERDVLFNSVIAEKCPTLKKVEFRGAVNTETSLKFFIDCPKLSKISTKASNPAKVIDFRLY